MKRLTNEEVFVCNSLYSRNHLKKRIIDERLLPYTCAECSNNGQHNGKKLSLQLDHINGISDDNRLENLRFLCPNCHSQTETYAGKSTKGKRVYINKKSPVFTNYHEEKLIRDRELWKSVKEDPNIRFGEWGWKVRVCEKLGVKSQKVVPWLRRVDPEFLQNYQ